MFFSSLVWLKFIESGCLVGSPRLRYAMVMCFGFLTFGTSVSGTFGEALVVESTVSDLGFKQHHDMKQHEKKHKPWI